MVSYLLARHTKHCLELKIQDFENIIHLFGTWNLLTKFFDHTHSDEKIEFVITNIACLQGAFMIAYFKSTTNQLTKRVSTTMPLGLLWR